MRIVVSHRRNQNTSKTNLFANDMFRIAVAVVFVMWTFVGLASTGIIVRGRVVDIATSEPMAFVHIRGQHSMAGGLTDIDGNFRIEVSSDETHLLFSFVGYNTLVHTLDAELDFHWIAMHRAMVELAEVVVFPGENPAHRIVENAIGARRQHDPMRLSAFSYISYNKLVATLDGDHFEQQWEQRGDSTALRVIQLLQRQYLLLMESVTQRRFRYPDLSNEVILANRVSGLENPLFTMLATELQSFSFYGNHVTLLGKDYVSPLNPMAFGRYFYLLEDTLYQGRDTVFVIRYRPSRNTRFEGLEGLLYIHSGGWALQNVVAAPHQQERQGFSFRIQQKYEQIDGVHWFPVQLNTDWEFDAGSPDTPSGLPIRVSTRSYLGQVEINPDFRRRDFSGFSIDFDPYANRVPEEVWDRFRPDTLTRRERNTYHFIDSLGREHNFERIVNLAEPLLFGEVPLGGISLRITDFYRYNQFERHRLGIGGATNRRFSRRIVAGGHWAWASGDRKSKYGYFGEWVLLPSADLRLGGGHSFDLHERGVTQFKQGGVLSLNELVRDLYAGTRDYSRQTRVYASWQLMRKYLRAEIEASEGQVWWTDEYAFLGPGYGEPVRQFHFAQAALKLRFAWGEQMMNTPLRTISLPSRWPVLSLNLVRGSRQVRQGDFDYWKTEGQLTWDYPIALIGQQYWLVEAGWADNAGLPWPLLFSARAADRSGMLAAPFSFGTMFMNEFVSDRYFHVFFQHNFRSLLFRTSSWTPELVLVGSAGWGSLRNKENHLFVPVKSYPKGYFESGVAINRILPQQWVRRVVLGVTPGIEVLWRYGAYAMPEKKDNLTLKLNLLFAL